jgi:hypothetical protein
MVAFDASGNVRWTVPGYGPKIATADGGVIAQAYDPDTEDFTGSSVTFDQNGSATGQMASLPTLSWFGNAYQVGSVDRIKALRYFFGGYWPFKQANLSGNGTAVLHQWFPDLPSCPDKGGICSGDLLWNAEVDLVRQRRNSADCSGAAQRNVFSKITDARGNPVTTDTFLKYIQHDPHFYNGATSTLDEKYALCGEHYAQDCQGNGLRVRDVFHDPTSGTTALTVTPSEPLKTFWQPKFTPPGKDVYGNPLDEGFGIGINATSYGVNIFNESLLLHETLHGMTALDEAGLQNALNSGNSPLSISKFIKNNVLSVCPTFNK